MAEALLEPWFPLLSSLFWWQRFRGLRTDCIVLRKNGRMRVLCGSAQWVCRRGSDKLLAMKTPTRIFITGASSGLGAGLARHYARPGVTLGLVARRRDLLATLQADLAQRGATVHVYEQDVCDTSKLAACARDFLERAQGIDLVLANAGVGIRNSIHEGESDEVAALMQINVIGVTNTLLPFVPTMLKQKSGTLVGMSSMAGHQALPGRTAYCASKAAVRVFMDGLRMDLHGTGVHAMTLCPGFVDTPLIQDNPSTFWVVDLERGVRLMAKAIAARKRTYTFPWQMNLLHYLAKCLPECVVRRLAPAPRTRSSLRREGVSIGRPAP